MKNKKLLITFSLFIISIILLISYILYQDINKHQPNIKIKNEVQTFIEKDKKLEEINKLYKENTDLYGWLIIDGTNINYPVMYTPNTDYYLYRDFYKNHFIAGSLFIDKNNSIKPRDTNLIIHGHNMKNKTMFHDLVNYKNKAFYEEHKKIILYTLNEKEEYEVISIFKSKIYDNEEKVFKYYDFYNANNDNEYNYYIDNIKKLNIYDNNFDIDINDELLTLSTCEYSFKNGRMVVIAKKIK